MKRADKVSYRIPVIIYLALTITIVASIIYSRSRPPSPYDINRDGAIDSSDSKIVYDVFLNCYVTTPSLIERCDVNCDGFVNDKDVAIVIEYVLTHDRNGNEYK